MSWRGLEGVRWSLRSRVIGLLGLGTIPLVMLAGLVIWQDYRTASQGPLDRISLLRSAVLASQRSGLAGVQDLLGAVSATPEVVQGTPEGCDRFLAGVLELHRNTYTRFGLLDSSGRLRCSTPLADGLAAEEAAFWLQPGAVTSSISLGLLPSPGGRDGLEVVAAMPVRQDGRLVGIMEAGLQPSWSGARLHEVDPFLGAWLFDSQGRQLPLGNSGVGLPDASVQERLLTTDAVLDAALPDGRLGAYASGLLGPLRLVIVEPAGAVADGAWNRLLQRGAALLVLLVAAFTVVAIGATSVIVTPIRELSDAVNPWDTGTPFARPSRRLPSELAVVADSMEAAGARLAQREAELERAGVRQDLLLQEVHHRVKNNLQVVASLLNLQASRIRQPQARAEFQSARDRVRALATLHRHLYIQGELHTINMRSFLVELCGQLFQAMGELEGDRIGLEIAAPELPMLSDQAVPLALIVTEAVGNALKYAFPHGRTGHIAVRLDAAGSTARLIVMDDGVGIPAGRAETECGPRDGIGLQLIRGFARQLGAVLTVDQGAGTRYVVELPLHAADRRERNVAAR